MTTKAKKTAQTTSPASDKVRKAVLAEIDARVTALEVAPAPEDATDATASATLATETPVAESPHAGSPVPSKGRKGGTSPKTGAKSKAEKAGKEAKPKAQEAKRLSCLDAAAKVLADADKPMKTQEMIEIMEAKGLWKSESGKTPAATLYAAIIREIGAKRKEARFKKTERGTFAHTGVEVD